ncbi:cation diffusion facilitator family transporter [Amycolatopsis sp. NPDC003861]
MGHSHGAAPEPGSASGKHVRRLTIAIGLGFVTFVIQLVVGLTTSSLALLSDSAHVFTDVLGVTMALAAILVARRSARQRGHTYGMYRGEVFAALFNAILLFAVAGWVLYEAVGRFAAPPDVPGLPVIIVAVVGLVMNFIALQLLKGGAKESLNVRGAYLEVMADMLGSVGVLASGLLTVIFDWRYADPAIAIAIGLFVLPRAFTLGRHAWRVLFQHAPPELDFAEVADSLKGLAGVHDVHDLHLWTLTSGMEVASAHITITPGAGHDQVLTAAQALLASRFGLHHATLQVESRATPDQCQSMTW